MMNSQPACIATAMVLVALCQSAIGQAGSENHEPRATMVLQDAYAMEAYFSHDGKRFIYQGREVGEPGPLQIYVCDFRPGQQPPPRPVRVTEGASNHECTFFSHDGNYIAYATAIGESSEEDAVDFGGYPYFYDMKKEIWVARLENNRITNRRRITDNNAYEAETSFSPPMRNLPGKPDGVYLLYTSSRDGNLDLWMRRVFDDRGKEVLDEEIQLTKTPTVQEGGAFFLSDHKIVYREWTFDSKNPNKEQMERNRVNFRPMQIHVLDLRTGFDTTVTHGNARHWAPFPHPGGRKIVFAKRDFSLPDHNFDIYVMDLDSGKQERMTSDPGFDGYPVFHPNGQVIMYSRYDRANHGFSLWSVAYPPATRRR